MRVDLSVMKFCTAVFILISISRRAGAGEVHDEADVDDAESDPSLIDWPLSADQLRTLHTKLDADVDGQVSLEEALKFSAAVKAHALSSGTLEEFEQADTDKDGLLSMEEHLQDFDQMFAAGRESEPDGFEQRKNLEAAKFRAADSNNDNRLDEHEFLALFFRVPGNENVLTVVVDDEMSNLDVDQNSVLSPIEFYQRKRVDELKEYERAEFDALDKNGDGSVDKRELRAWVSGAFVTENAMKQLIKVADQNGDGHLTSHELADAGGVLSKHADDAMQQLIDFADHLEL